jgi:hypothetical protein
LRHFYKSFLFPTPGKLLTTSLRPSLRLKTFSREAWGRKILAVLGAHFLRPGQNGVGAEGSKGMLKLLQEPEVNHLMEARQAASPGFKFLSVLQNVCTIANRGYFESAISNR